ncbi:hypothetical protein, partial [Chelativorans composti]
VTISSGLCRLLAIVVLLHGQNHTSRWTRSMGVDHSHPDPRDVRPCRLEGLNVKKIVTATPLAFDATLQAVHVHVTKKLDHVLRPVVAHPPARMALHPQEQAMFHHP